MVVYGEGRYRCATHGAGPPAAASRRRPRRRPLRATLPALRPRRWRRRPIGEDAPTDPRNVYAATKLHQEHLAFAFARETGAPVTALRYHNVYGPRMPRDTPYAGVAAIFAARSPPGARRGSSRTAASCATSSTCATSRAPTSLALLAPRAGAGRLQRVLGHAAQRRRDGPRAARRARRRRRRPSRSRASTGSATSATSSPQRRSPPTSWASSRGRTSPPAMAELADEHRVNPARETASAQRATATLGP